LREINDLIFNDSRWHDSKLKKGNGESILDYGILEWQHIMKMIEKKHSKEEGRLMELLNKVWCPPMSFVHGMGGKIKRCC